MFVATSFNLWMLKGAHVKKFGIDWELKHFTIGLFEAVNNGM
jgi:hypothetical protein